MRKRRMMQVVAQIPLVSRESWDARPPKLPPAFGRVEAAVVHHTATPWDREPGPAAVRAICELHRDDRGWADIGYNLVVDGDGAVYEGRAGGAEAAVVGAHARGWNDRTTGIALIGEYGSEAPSPAALEALARLLAWKLGLHGLRPDARAVLGHRDLDPSSACPGGALHAVLPAVRRRAAEIADSGGRGARANLRVT